MHHTRIHTILVLLGSLVFSIGTTSCRIKKTTKEQCTICHENLNFKKHIQTLTCKHRFHKACIAQWYKNGPQETHNKCPLCQQEYKPSKKLTIYAPRRPVYCTDTYTILTLLTCACIGILLHIRAILTHNLEQA